MHRALGTLALTLLVFVAAPAAAETRTAAAADPPRIVAWTSIGDVHLGDTAVNVKRRYGKAQRVQDVSRTMPHGTRWSGHHVVDRTFRVGGGELWVRTVDGRVRAIATTSPRYTTPRGIRAGLHIHSRCHEDGSSGDCIPEWRGFVYRDCTGWVYGRRGLVVSLGWKRDRVARVAFGEPNALLICI